MIATYSIPGVYRRPLQRGEGFPRVRTDIAGFVGIAGARMLGRAIAVDDWKGYVSAFGAAGAPDTRGLPSPEPDGATLPGAIRSFFANGGRRAWIVNVAPRVDPARAQELLNTMLGIGRDPQPHGLELLLRQDEVSLVVLPELDATWPQAQQRFDDDDDPGNPCFGDCTRLGTAGVAAAQRPRPGVEMQRLYSDDELLWSQRYIITRLLQQRWRWFAIFATPPGLTPQAAVAWRERLTRGSDEGDIAGLYWPWVLQQPSPGSEVAAASPVGAVAGIFAAVDVESGPQAAPANRRIDDAVGLQAPGVDDEANRLAYDAGVNVLRAFPGQGIRVWGARTLTWRAGDTGQDALAFVNARRCLSAIARTAEVVGRPLVFEPNTVMLRIKLHQLMTDYLLGVFASGALMGELAEEAFFVAVDTVEESAEAELVCRIGVALAAPAEFIVFRIGRDGGVIERQENS
ncbi:MAG TPA: phage tail sheath subtilisin-like domain-containing protein [Burkholderiaceae bacterium]|nr:phage tail sheath subtilisin-like domain-containing protein [Burkholderiaceae bacterium]